jgi:hypothetical protein
MKRDIVARLSTIKTKEATDYLMELLSELTGQVWCTSALVH